MNHSDGEDFKVTDKRHSAEKGTDQKDSSDSKSTESEQPDSAPLPDVNFSTFLFSLNMSALVHLGENPELGSGETKKAHLRKIRVTPSLLNRKSLIQRHFLM